jgi:integrase
MGYRHLGKQQTLSFGKWPDVELLDARDRRDRARKLLASGGNPALEKRREREAACTAASNTFKSVAEEWFAKQQREGLAEITLEKMRWLLGKAYPTIGSLPIDRITAQEVLKALRGVEAGGRYESARRMRSVLSRVFRYAIATARANRDVAADLRGALTTPKPKHHAAITASKEVGALMRAIEGFTGHPITLMALRLSAHLFVRPGELRRAEWSEFDFETAVWSIPAEKMKMRLPHKVPLSTQVMAFLELLQGTTGNGKYLFPSFRSRFQPMSENTVNAALRRLGYGQDEMSAHGFRALAATLLNEMGIWSADAIERQLAHQAIGVRRAYARGEYWDERVRMMQHWSDHLESLRGPSDKPQSASSGFESHSLHRSAGINV